MPSTTGARSETWPPAVPQPKHISWLLASIATVVALVVGGVIGWAIFGGSDRTLTGPYGSVQVQDAYNAKVVFLNSGRDAGCLQPLNGEKKLCTAFALLPGAPRLVRGGIVHAVVMTVLHPNGNGYGLALLWPSQVPPG